MTDLADIADFIVTAPDNSVQLVVEAKRRLGASPEWAAELRRNLLAHAPIPPAPYFLLALPDRFYLWKHAPATEPAAPQYTVDARSQLWPYLDRLQTPLAELSGEGFGLVVQAWLSDLLTALAAGSGGEPASFFADLRGRWLLESGLADALRRGRLHVTGAALAG